MFRYPGNNLRRSALLLNAAKQGSRTKDNNAVLISSAVGQQQRHFFKQFFQQQAVKKMRTVLDGTTDERKLVDYIRALGLASPRDAIVSIERGWESGKLPINEAILKEYFKAAASLNKLDTINITGLLAMLHKNGIALEGDLAAGGLGNQAALASILKSSQRFTAGSSPSDPLFIANPEISWKTQAWRMLRYGVSMFLLLSFAGAVLDEKGPAGGLSSRLGGGSAVHQAEKSDKRFDDVVGIDEAKHELQEIVMYLKDGKRFTRLGGRLPKGILLTGPPGTGKTLLARAIAGEAGVPFFYSSGSEFEEMYVGVGARRVRDLFEAAKAKSPCIIFIDEIDAIGGSRHLKEQSAMKMTLNQLLVEMDGFEQNSGVIVIAATNFPETLDSALIRPGRFDRHVDVPMPDIGGRKAILDLYSKKIPLGKDVDLEQLARGTPGFSGAELSNLVNQAALKASVDGLKSVGMHAFEYAKDKILMGAERKSAIISPETMRMTAFHEAGHALVALKTDGSDPIHKATIMPRGRALGMVMQLPDGDQTSMTRKQMLARLDICMGGRVAEEVVYGHDNVTSGASSDIQQATRIATAMVKNYGLSDKVGMLFIDDKDKHGGEMQGTADQEIRQLLSDSYSRAKKLIETHRKELDIVAQGLQDYESLSGSEIVDLINGVVPNVKGLRSQRPSREAQPLPGTKNGATPGTTTVPAATATATVAAAATVAAKSASAVAASSSAKAVNVAPATAAAVVAPSSSSSSPATATAASTATVAQQPVQQPAAAKIPAPHKSALSLFGVGSKSPPAPQATPPQLSPTDPPSTGVATASANPNNTQEKEPSSSTSASARGPPRA